MMAETTSSVVPFLAGVLSGRGGFGFDDKGKPWVFLYALDAGVAEEAAKLWGGRVTARPNDAGQFIWKWSLNSWSTVQVLEDLLPYLRGYKKDRAEEMLRQSEGGP